MNDELNHQYSGPQPPQYMGVDGPPPPPPPMPDAQASPEERAKYFDARNAAERAQLEYAMGPAIDAAFVKHEEHTVVDAEAGTRQLTLHREFRPGYWADLQLTETTTDTGRTVVMGFVPTHGGTWASYIRLTQEKNGSSTIDNGRINKETGQFEAFPKPGQPNPNGYNPNDDASIIMNATRWPENLRVGTPEGPSRLKRLRIVAGRAIRSI